MDLKPNSESEFIGHQIQTIVLLKLKLRDKLATMPR